VAFSGKRSGQHKTQRRRKTSFDCPGHFNRGRTTGQPSVGRSFWPLFFFLLLASLKQLSRIPCCDVNEDNARRFNLLCVGVCIAASRLLLVFALFNWKLNKCPGSRLIVWPTVLRDFGPDGGHLSRAIVVVPGPIVRLISFTSRKPLAHKDSHCCGLVIRPFYGGNNENQPEKSI